MKGIKNFFIFLGSFLFIMFWPYTCLAVDNSPLKQNDQSDYEKISVLLFPETKSWDVVSKM